jgi:hypothetical protein
MVECQNWRGVVVGFSESRWEGKSLTWMVLEEEAGYLDWSPFWVSPKDATGPGGFQWMSDQGLVQVEAA